LGGKILEIVGNEDFLEPVWGGKKRADSIDFESPLKNLEIELILLD
jgi:hypothetical protein